MTDIELVQSYFKIEEDKAIRLIDSGINLDFLRNGPQEYVKNELGKVADKFQSKVESMVEEELVSDD